jgi:hypothetical protein
MVLIPAARQRGKNSKAGIEAAFDVVKHGETFGSIDAVEER